MPSKRQPDFLKLNKTQPEPKTNLEIMEYLKSKIGPQPTVSGARRRWSFLKAISEHIYHEKSEDFNSLVRWMAHSCECMKPRTVREDYVEYLALLGVLDWNLNSQTVTWKGEP
jgi:hypothetical protein